MFKGFVRKYKLSKILDQTTTNLEYKGFGQVKTVGICFKHGKLNNEIITYSDGLRKLGKEVHLLEYIPKRARDIEKEGIQTPYPWFCKNNVNRYGQPSGKSVNDFTSTHYGVYLDLINEEEHPVDFITAKVNADFKIGSNIRPDLKYNMLMAFKDDNFTAIFKEIDYYLNFINQNAQ